MPATARIALAAVPHPKHRHTKSSVNMSAVYLRSCLHYSIFPDQSEDSERCRAAGVRLHLSVSNCCTIRCAEEWWGSSSLFMNQQTAQNMLATRCPMFELGDPPMPKRWFQRCEPATCEEWSRRTNFTVL